MTVKAIKLISGEELVSEVLFQDEEVITLKNPLLILMRPGQDGSLTIGFAPFAPYLGKDPSFSIKLDKVIFASEVDTQMANQYNSLFGGIVTPPKQIILG